MEEQGKAGGGSSFLLRVEGVNMDWFIFDTEKIQPTRGGGFVLNRAVEGIGELTFNGLSFNKIVSGGSVGLFKFNACDEDDAQKAANQVEEYLHNATGGHATFVVDIIKETGDFQKDYNLLIAMNRFRQYQQPTFIIPKEVSDDACYFDGVRPADEEYYLPDKQKIYLSSSVSYRLNEGKKLRSALYTKILSDSLEDSTLDTDALTFTEDLHELAGSSNHGNLDGKVAFIYFDGNRFSRIQNEKVHSFNEGDASLVEFERALKSVRKRFLSALVSKAFNDADFKTEDGRIRLETLLWGGDELEFIVPAWKGLEVLELLYKHLNNSFQGCDLTHASGVLFCHMNAPITEMKAIAHRLSDMAKDALPKGDGDTINIHALKHHNSNLCRYLVLESFDTVGHDLEGFMNRYYEGINHYELVLNMADMQTLMKLLTDMKKNDFPRKKLFEILKALPKGSERMVFDGL